MIQEPKTLEINCSDVFLSLTGVSNILVSLIKHGAINDAKTQMLYADVNLKTRVAEETDVSMSTVRREIKKYCECGVLTKLHGSMYEINTNAIKAVW